MKIIILILFSSLAIGQNHLVNTFGEAKAHLRLIYGNKNKTFYCACDYQKNSIAGDCQLFFKNYKKRKKRLEWEHVVPAHSFGQSFYSWREHKKICPAKKNKKGKLKFKGSRKCAHKKDKLFRFMEADLYNLVPSVGAVNALRSNYSFVDTVDSKKSAVCTNGPVILARKIQPPARIKGDIARIYQYMDLTYPNRGIISKKNKSIFELWSKSDPVDKNECSIYQKKKNIQKNNNPILEKLCLNL
jgi:deoxyribonuclease-1